MAQPPPGMEALWPKERGILRDGQIVRLEDGKLAEWYPVPLSWLTPQPSPSENNAPPDHYPPLQWSRERNSPPEAASSQDFPSIEERSDGWILWSKPNSPSLAESMRLAKDPLQKAGILRGLARLASQELESPSTGRILLDPETIFTPFGWTSDLSSPFKAYALPPSSAAAEEDKVRDWVALLGKLGSRFWSEDGLRFQAIAHTLGNKAADTEIGVSTSLKDWADRLDATASKDKRRRRNVFLLGAALFCLLIATILGLANWNRAAGKTRALENERRRELLLREEQAKLIGFDGRSMADGLPGNVINDGPFTGAAQLAASEVVRWRAWMRLAATFDKGDSSHPELLGVRALGHDLVHEPVAASLLWTRLAGGKGPWPARACLHLAMQKKEQPDESKEWLDRATEALTDWEETPETERLRAAVNLAHSRYLTQSKSPKEAEAYVAEAGTYLWGILERKEAPERARNRVRALALYLPILPDNERKLGKFSNLIDETSAEFPAYYPLIREKIRLLAQLRQSAASRTEAKTVAALLRRTITDAWRRFPERREHRLAEIASVLDAALMADDHPPSSDSRPGDSQPGDSTGLEIWALALAKLEEFAADKPKDRTVLQETARLWTTGGLIADQGSGRLGLSIESYAKALAAWDLLARLESPSPENTVARARLNQEIAWAAERSGDAVLAQEQRKQAREAASQILREFPGSVDALEVMMRIEETLAWDAVLNGALPRARLALQTIDQRLLQYRQSSDEADRFRFQWILMRRALLEILIELKGDKNPDRKKVDRLMGELKATLTANKQDSASKTFEFSEEMDRLRARVAALEVLRLQKEKASKEKIETQLSLARVAQNKALLSHWEKNQFDALWLGIK